MAIPSKSSTALIAANTSIPAGATATSTTLDMRTYFEAGITVSVSVGASSPSTGPTINCQISKDGTSWILYQQVSGPTTASQTTHWTFTLPDWALYAQLTIKNEDSAAISITAAADAQFITGVS